MSRLSKFVLPLYALQFSRPRTRTVPRHALRFSATLDDIKKSEEALSDTDEESLPEGETEKKPEFAEGEAAPEAEKPAEPEASADPLAPLTVPAVIRTGEVVTHPYWGPCINDLAGFQPPEGAEPVDYCHNADEIVGFGDAWQVSEGRVTANITLVPHTAEDRASEVIAKGKKGVPYEASVLMDEASLIVEQVVEGATTEVNGQTITGPVVVFRQWRITGVAVCPQGVDGGTSLTFPGSPNAEVQLQEEPAAEPAPTEEKPAATATEEAFAEDPPADPPADEKKKDEESEKFSRQPAEALRFSAAEGKRFMLAFGQQGAVWFAQGLTFSQAQGKFTAGQQAENVRLKAENETLKKQLGEAQQKLAFNRGQSAPLTFMPATPPAGKAAPNQFAALTPNLAKFASGIKFAKPEVTK